MRNKFKILFIGANGYNALKRAHALRRLGHDVRLIDPYSFFPWRNFVGRLVYYAGAAWLESYLKYKITPIIKKSRYDVGLCG